MKHNVFVWPWTIHTTEGSPIWQDKLHCLWSQKHAWVSYKPNRSCAYGSKLILSCTQIPRVQHVPIVPRHNLIFGWVRAYPHWTAPDLKLVLNLVPHPAAKSMQLSCTLSMSQHWWRKTLQCMHTIDTCIYCACYAWFHVQDSCAAAAHCGFISLPQPFKKNNM